MKNRLYKNFRRIRKPFYVPVEDKRIKKLKGNKLYQVDLDVQFPDSRHEFDETIDKIKSIGMRILRIFKSITQENDISYFLYWGSLLGAVRHGGYIPWDDDLDIAMTRSDFKKFEKLLYQLPLSIEVLCMDHGFYKLMDKYSFISKDGLRGVGLDIFIIEHTKESYTFYNVHQYCTNYLTKDQLLPTREMLFENDLFTVPNKAEEILKIKYGDYMQLPPVEKRVFPHLGTSVKILDFPQPE